MNPRFRIANINAKEKYCIVKFEDYIVQKIKKIIKKSPNNIIQRQPNNLSRIMKIKKKKKKNENENENRLKVLYSKGEWAVCVRRRKKKIKEF